MKNGNTSPRRECVPGVVGRARRGIRRQVTAAPPGARPGSPSCSGRGKCDHRIAGDDLSLAQALGSINGADGKEIRKGSRARDFRVKLPALTTTIAGIAFACRAIQPARPESFCAIRSSPSVGAESVKLIITVMQNPSPVALKQVDIR